MKIHYFQRYHQKENVATANTMLLLSRLYQYSSDKFYHFFKQRLFSNTFEPEIAFKLQDKSVDSVPDATITQESFKIVVETKLSDWFYDDQLLRHLKSFGDEKYQVLLSLCPEPMNEEKKKEFDKKLDIYNQTKTTKIVHINMTFEELIKAVQEIIDENRDYEMQDVLNDYFEYCIEDNLIVNADAWKYLRVQLCSNTFDFNVKENLYYDSIDRGFRAHAYLGLYKEKSVRAIGKLDTIIVATVSDCKDVQFRCELGIITEDKKQKILNAMKECNLSDARYFFVENFVETDFKKITPRAPMGSRIFDLTQVFDFKKEMSVEEIADKLKSYTWE